MSALSIRDMLSVIGRWPPLLGPQHCATLRERRLTRRHWRGFFVLFSVLLWVSLVVVVMCLFDVVCFYCFYTAFDVLARVDCLISLSSSAARAMSEALASPARAAARMRPSLAFLA